MIFSPNTFHISSGRVSQTFFDAEPFLVQKLSREPQILIILYGHNINIIYKAGSFNLSQKFIAQEMFFMEPQTVH